MSQPWLAVAEGVETTRKGGKVSVILRSILRAVSLVPVLLGTLIVATPADARMEPSSTDRGALISLYNATDGPNWFKSQNWLSDQPLSNWYGVSADNTGRITELVLMANGLIGKIPAKLGGLSNLEVLDLSVNKLGGGIPIELGGLSKLLELNLRDNELSGKIPPELGRLSNLELLELSQNSLSGQIPTQFGELSNLTLLHLNENKLSGNLPRSLIGLSAIRSLIFEYNAGLCAPGDDLFREWLNGMYRSGPICHPTHAGDRAVLLALYNAADGPNWRDSTLWLSDEPLYAWHGVATDDTGRVIRLGLQGNNLAGHIPPEVGNLSALRRLSLGGNELAGQIPSEIAKLENLELLWLGENRLRGPIPAELGDLSYLRQLIVTSNQLGGQIPKELGDLSSLSILYLSHNQLSGEIPAEIGKLSNLSQMGIRHNQLTGKLPQSLTKLSSLQHLYFGYNSGLCAPADDAFQEWFNGIGHGSGPACQAPNAGDRAILEALYNATDGPNWEKNTNWLSQNPLNTWHGVETDGARVTEVDLVANRLTGQMPPELGNLSKLWSLHLDGNQLIGPIPAELGNLSGLGSLRLGKNQLTGQIPAELGNLSKLWSLHLDGNQLTGQIPAEFGQLFNLTMLLLGGNQLSGEIPPGLAGLSTLEWLGLGANHLSGKIPTEFGNLPNLTLLSLHQNQLSGHVPSELGRLSELRILSVSTNQLSGTLPQSLTGLSQLTTLRFDYNDGLCAPNDAFLEWLNGIEDRWGPVCQPSHAGDRTALVAVYNATDGSNWANNTNWNSEQPLFAWHGVVTDDNGRVIRLNLNGNRLTGVIPPELGHLTELRFLYLDVNRLIGKIPTELGDLLNLQRLGLSYNQLTGRIPTELGNLTNLVELALTRNQLRGQIPTELGDLSNIIGLHLQGNQLSGHVPTELGGLSNLQTLHLGGNQLTGQIPVTMVGLSNLVFLDLSGNRLSGKIPSELGNLASLQTLSLQGNQLSGCVPMELRGLPDFDQPDLPFCDLLLRSLSVSPRSLTPSFDPYRMRYLAANGSPFVTLSVESDHNAAVQVLNQDHIPIEDGHDTLDGHQLNLAAGIKSVLIEVVSSEDGAYVVYTIEVSRGHTNIPYDSDNDRMISQGEAFAAVRDFLRGLNSWRELLIVLTIYFGP